MQKKEISLFKQILDLASAVIYIKDDQGRYTFINRYFELLSGLPADQVVGRTDYELFPKEVAENAYNNDRKVFESGIPLEIEEFGPVSGEMHTFLSAKFPLYDEKRQIQRTRRLESLNKLAGGIAHNFNNLLASIQFSAELIQMENAPTPSINENLSNIFKCINSGSQLTQQLLGMAGSGKYTPKPLNINENILKCLKRFSRDSCDIKISWKLQERVWPIKADRAQIHIVLTSLFNRAGQAMGQGGYLFVSSENLTLHETEAALHNLAPGRFVKISVSDTGSALDHSTQEHIFDPFSTDLAMRGGKGLGLASAYGITRNHGGNITLESIQNKGTTFHIYLPAIETPKPAPADKATAVKKTPQTVLLVDDEKIYAQTGAAMLEKIGFEVLVAGDAETALETFAAHREKVELILLDMIIPGASGEEIYKELRTIDPYVKIILCSGYSIHGKASRIMVQGCNGFLQKPFSLEQLSLKIREAINQG